MARRGPAQLMGQDGLTHRHRRGLTAMLQPELEAAPQTERVRLQSERLRSLVARLAASDVPYWREKLAGVDPDRVNSIRDLPLLPLTTKPELRETYPFGMLTVPLEDTVRIHASSGTRGKPTVVAYTAH